MCPQKLEEEIAALEKRGVSVEAVEAGGQWYALQHGVPAPMPPWDKQAYDILVAIPTAYDAASLDAFYLGLPYKFKTGTHPRVQGTIITVKARQWQLVSWHYPDGKAWVRGLDDLGTHLTHCRGFFLNRGAINAY
jgi:hypothetical protein